MTSHISAHPQIKAVILVGGDSVGTRFRPLAMDCVKPLFPIAGNATIYHHVQALVKVPGMTEIFLVGFYEQHVFDRFLMETQIEFPSIPIRYLREYQPMGTAGGVHHFRDEILRGNPHLFFVLNADIASSFPLESMVKAQRKTSAVATIMSIKMAKEAAKRFGCLVVDQATQEIQHFVHKPESFVSERVSCGVYLFTSAIFDLISNAIEEKGIVAKELGMDLTQFQQSSKRATIISSQARASMPQVQFEMDVLRYMANKQLLYAFTCDQNQFWRSIKTGSSTIHANKEYLQYFMQAFPRRLSTPLSRVKSTKGKSSPMGLLANLSESPTRSEGAEIISPVYIHPTAVIHPSAKLGPNVSIGARCLVGHGVRIRDAIILDNVEIHHDAFIMNSVIGWESKIGAWARIEGSVENPVEEGPTVHGSKRPSACILGKNVIVNDELIIRDCIVLPHKELAQSYHREIIM